MKWVMFFAFGVTLVFNGAARADLLTDGSFENATQGSYFSGTITNSAWQVTSSGTNLHGVIIQPTGGSSYPADPLTSGDPQAGGTQVAYFVGDTEMDTLSQTITGLQIGISYQVGFDIETPFNGRQNPGIATFSASVGGTTLLSTMTNQLPAPANGTDNSAWVHESGNFIATSTTATFTFTFSTLGNSEAGQDVLIDRVYVDTTASIATPEPASLTMLGLGALGLMGYGWRRKRKAATATA
jgi:PEP-CTERM motif